MGKLVQWFNKLYPKAYPFKPLSIIFIYADSLFIDFDVDCVVPLPTNCQISSVTYLIELQLQYICW